MKLGTPVEWAGQTVSELNLPLRVKAKYLRGISPRALGSGSYTYDDMERVVDQVYQLNGGTAGEMDPDDLQNAFDEAVGFLFAAALTKSSSDGGESPPSD